MPEKKYLVTLTADERNQLDALIRKGTAAARVLARARILLKADPADGGGAGLAQRLPRARPRRDRPGARAGGSGLAGAGDRSDPVAARAVRPFTVGWSVNTLPRSNNPRARRRGARHRASSRCSHAHAPSPR